MLHKIFFPAICALVFSIGSSQLDASIVFQDDFSSYASGTTLNPGNGWSARWENNTQQNLYSVDSGGTLSLDTATAYRNYHGLNNTAIQLGTDKTITVSSDFQYTHLAGGNITTNLNKSAIGLMVSTTPDWWNGTNAVVSLSNRGGAMGLTVPVAPWITSWMTHQNLGVNTTTGGTSDWIKFEFELYDNGTDVIGSMFVRDAAGNLISDPNTPSFTTNIASGSTIYAGYSTNWNNVGATSTIESFSNISRVAMDNFLVTSVPEPGSIVLAAFGFAGCFLPRRRR